MSERDVLTGRATAADRGVAAVVGLETRPRPVSTSHLYERLEVDRAAPACHPWERSSAEERDEAWHRDDSWSREV